MPETAKNPSILSKGFALSEINSPAVLPTDVLFDGAFIHIDETVVQVLKEPDKKPTSNCYMWVQTGGPPGKPVVIFDYDPSRSGEVPVRLLQGYQGYLMTDGYDGYIKLAKTEGIERDHKDATDAARLLARQQFSVAALADLHAWMEKTLPVVTPKSALGTALSYMCNYWPMLTRYTERGDLPIDNNRAENSIRPFVIGRKAWLFSDTPAGANASAITYSLIETAKACDPEPYTWLRRVLRDLPAAKTVEAIEALLPWNLNEMPLTNHSAPFYMKPSSDVG